MSMKTDRKAILAAALAILGLSAVDARADDWVMWGGTPERNMVNLVEKNIPAEWDIETGENIAWRARLGSQTYGNPTVSGGKIFVGTNNQAERQPKATDDKGVVMCFSEKDGKFLWQLTHDKLAAGRVNDWPRQGICSSPAVDGDRIYYVSNQCHLVCADTEGFLDGENDGPFKDETLTDSIDGDIVWSFDMMDELGVFPHNLATCSPTYDDKYIYLVTGNGVDEGHVVIPDPYAPSFIAIDKRTGELAWEAANPGEHILHGQWSNPALGTIGGVRQVVFPGGDGALYSFVPESGELLWSFQCNPADSVWRLGGLGTRNNIIATPVIHDDRVFISVGQDPEHGEAPGHMYAVDGTKRGDITGKGAVWHNEDVQRAMSTPAIHDGIVYMCDLSGFFRALDAATGKTLWEHDVLAAVWSSPYLVDGKVFLGDEDGDVVVFKEGREKKVLFETNMGNSVYTTPVAANGVLYITNRMTLFAIASGAKSDPKEVQ
jgi:outer membrane protein assembly factor BamB